MRTSLLVGLFAVAELIRAFSFQASASTSNCMNPRIPSSVLTDSLIPKSYFGKMKTAELQISGHRFHLVLAKTVQDLMKGLMCVPKIKSNAGMLFVFDKPQTLDFWMERTRIPLDMIWINKEGRITSIATNVPAAEKTSKPARRSGYGKYVLELNSGSANLLGLHVGSSLAVGGL